MLFSMDEFRQNLRKSTGFRVFIYLMALFGCSLLGGLVTLLLTHGIVQLKIGQGISSALIFIAPPLILYAFTREQPLREIGFRKPISAWLFLLGVALMFISLPLTNLLTSWNEQMSLGTSFEVLEKWMQMLEDTAKTLTDQMLQVDTIWGLLGNLLVIALIPAIGEELTFRGMLQQGLVRRCKNPHVGIILSAAIFSFIHFQFYGFLPRMFLGILLGYLFYYSGSLWVSILMHFVNNGAAVVVAYLEYKGLTEVDMDHFGETSNLWLIGASFLLTVGAVMLSRIISEKYGRE